MFKRLRFCAVALAMAAPSFSGCGGASGHQPTAGHSGTIGREGGQHALGSDSTAETARIKKAHAAASAPSPGRLPGR